MIDFHTHTLLSDGDLVPSELVRRAFVKGYGGIAITDHVDDSNIEHVVTAIVRFAGMIRGKIDLEVIPGAELTHIPPDLIAEMALRAREHGARFVVVHGETIAEPVAPGTNEAALNADIDMLAHPGLITENLAALASKRSIYLELSSRQGHSLTNGHVAAIARKVGAPLLLNTDAHAPEDLINDDMMIQVARGAGLDEEEARGIGATAVMLFERLRNRG